MRSAPVDAAAGAFQDGPHNPRRIPMKTALCMMLLAGTAVADTPAKKDAPKEAPKAMEAPKPAKELDAMKDWQKAWNCTSTNPAGEKVTAKLTLKKELDGFWTSIKLEAAKTKTMPAFNGQGYIGIDPVGKGWVFNGVDNMGGWIMLKSKDASATAMTWDGDAAMGDKKTSAKFTMTNDKKAVKFIGEFGGKKAFEYDCK
jgi:hypothetical protein